jgi:hypothetical protein
MSGYLLSGAPVSLRMEMHFTRLFAILACCVWSALGSSANSAESWDECIEGVAPADVCSGNFDRLKWTGTDAKCETAFKTLRLADEARKELPWSLLYLNERCGAEGRKHYAREQGSDTSSRTQNYRECVESGTLPSVCDEKFDRIEWMPTEPGCATTRVTLNFADEQKWKLSWKLLYYNERCRADRLTHYERVASTSAPADTSTSSATEEFVVYRDQDSGFAMAYPSTWSLVPTEHPQTRVMVVSQGGAGTTDCNVVVTSDVRLTSMTPQEFADAINRPKDVEASLKSRFPGFTVIESGITQLDRQSAFTYKAEYPYELLGVGSVGIPWKLLSLVTLKHANVYTITCRAPEAQFDDAMAVFNVILAAFSLPPG